MSAIVLLSGGMDSVIAFYHTLNRVVEGTLTGPVHAISYAYGQRHEREVNAAHKIWQHARESEQYRRAPAVGDFRTIASPPGFLMPATGSLMGQAPVRKYGESPTRHEAEKDPAFIPHRNLLFISIAATWVRHYSASEIVTGLRGGYPDCSIAFEQAVNLTLSESDPAHRVTVSSPVHDSRAECVALAAGIPGCLEALGMSITCFEGKTPPCGKCLPCIRRAEGFREAGLRDPIYS